jgi:hypothetical protein
MSQADGRALRWGFAIIIAIGVGLRVAYFLPDTSLWGDEAALASSLVSRTVGELAQPLEHDQQAPYLFLVAERLLYEGFGLSERWLRLPAFVASVLAVPMFAWLAVRMGGPAAGLVAAALFAFCPILIRYGAELKPYALDVLATITLLWVAERVLAQQYSRSSLAALASVGAGLVWLSYPIVFVLAAVGFTIACDRLLRRRWDDLGRIGGVLAVWALSALPMYFLFVSRGVSNESLQDFWSYAFPPLPPGSLWDVRRSIELFFEASNLVGLAGTGISASLLILGAVTLARHDWRLLGFCLGPIVFTFIASALQLYPFATRLLLFLVPVCVVQMAVGLAGLRLPGLNAFTPGVLAVVLLAAPIAATNDQLEQVERSGVRDMLGAIRASGAPGDALYVYGKARMSYAIYARQHPASGRHVVLGALNVREGSKLTEDLRKLTGQQRVWFLFSEVHTFFVDEEQLLRREVERHGRLVRTLEVGPARAYLYESLSGQWHEERPQAVH